MLDLFSMFDGNFIFLFTIIAKHWRRNYNGKFFIQFQFILNVNGKTIDHLFLTFVWPKKKISWKNIFTRGKKWNNKKKLSHWCKKYIEIDISFLYETENHFLFPIRFYFIIVIALFRLFNLIWFVFSANLLKLLITKEAEFFLFNCDSFFITFYFTNYTSKNENLKKLSNFYENVCKMNYGAFGRGTIHRIDPWGLTRTG